MAVPLDWEGRSVVDLIERVLELYLRHKDTIDPIVGVTVKGLLEGLLAELPYLVGLNAPGPQ